MRKKVNFGVVGLGHIGKRHVNCIVNHKKACLNSIYDILPTQDFINSDLLVSSFSELINKDIDVVNICTPNHLHANMAIDALMAGKHVVIEKPMALTTHDAQMIVDTALKCDKYVFCVMQNRFSPTIIWIKDIIEKQLLGKIHMISLNCFWNRNKDYYLNSQWHGSKEKDGGPLFTQFSHFIDIIYWLFGTIDKVDPDFFFFRKKKYIEFEDSGIVKFNFSNNTIGVLNYSTAVWNKNMESSITMIGEYGSVKIGGQYMDKVVYCDIKDYTQPVIDAKIECNDYGTYKGSASNHDKMIDNVVNVLIDNASVHTNAIDGLNVVKIIENIYNYRN